VRNPNYKCNIDGLILNRSLPDTDVLCVARYALFLAEFGVLFAVSLRNMLCAFVQLKTTGLAGC
jgi:hypothetical protein